MVRQTTEGYGIYLYLLTGSDADVSITTLTNSGTISGTAATSEGYGIYLNAYYEDASITTLTNSGTISGTQRLMRIWYLFNRSIVICVCYYKHSYKHWNYFRVYS